MTEEERKNKLRIYLDIARDYPFYGKLSLSDDERSMFLKCLLAIRSDKPVEEDIAAAIFGVQKDFGTKYARQFYEALYNEITKKHAGKNFLTEESFFSIKNSVICQTKDIGQIVFNYEE